MGFAGPRVDLFGLLLLAAIGLGTGAQTTRQPGQTPIPESTRSLVPGSMAGEDLFQFYCSACHGRDAKGQTPRASLRTQPPDLTRLSHRNGGTFPRARVEETITKGGGPDLEHGTWDMPVWGWIFRGLDPSETLVQVRIASLVRYLESIQEP